jgi:hypothetical protein
MVPRVFRLRCVSKISLESWHLWVPEVSRQFVDSIISAAKTWQGLETIRLKISGVDDSSGDSSGDYSGDCDCSVCKPREDGVDICNENGLYFLRRLNDLSRLRELYLVGYEDDISNLQLLSALVDLTLTGLQTLSLVDVLHCDDDIVMLTAAPPTLWASLRKLEIQHGIEGGDGASSGSHCVAYLLQAAAPHLKRLRELNIQGYEICAHGAQMLERAAPFLSEVQSIQLQLITFMPKAAAPFLRAIVSGSLEELSLEFVNIGCDGAQALAGAAAGLPRLRRLELIDDVGDDGTIDVVQAAFEDLPLLESLVLELNV